MPKTQPCIWFEIFKKTLELKINIPKDVYVAILVQETKIGQQYKLSVNKGYNFVFQHSSQPVTS